jgi:HD-GYP domain-containing protein (c-di-GMP phosphodiesterase class II)
VSHQSLAAVTAATIQMGPIPFTLYASDGASKVVLFCRAGFPITERHKVILERADRRFYIGSDEVGLYHDYALTNIERIVADSRLNQDAKTKLIKNIGRRIIGRLYSEPRSEQAMRQSGDFVETYISLILDSQVAVNNLFAAGKTSSFALAHGINVCTFCLLIGQIIYGEDREVLWRLGLGGLLLDIGMSVLDRQVLDGSGPLKKDERNLMRSHTLTTEQLMNRHRMPVEILAMGRSHHERADGSGYPDGLKLDQIHPFARIAAVADVYDAMTTSRNYRKGSSKGHIAALAEMSINKHLFDETVLKALLQLVLHNDELVAKFLAAGPEIRRLMDQN